MTNRQRIARARTALATRAAAEEASIDLADPAHLCDLLADLRHYAAYSGIDYAAQDRAAAEHFWVSSRLVGEVAGVSPGLIAA